MNRQQAKELIPILQAFIEGKTIQIRKHGEESYYDSTNSNLNFVLDHYDYRIKAEPKYRSFKDAEECWQEMQKHQPFGWLCDKLNNQYYYITALDDYGIVTTPFDEICYTKHIDSMKRKFTFADGTPFGIKD